MAPEKSEEVCEEWCPLTDSEFCPADPKGCPLRGCRLIQCPEVDTEVDRGTGTEQPAKT